MASLVGVEGPLKGQTFKLSGEMVLGRSVEAHIRIDDSAVSRQHAKIRGEGVAWTVQDLGSSNGTYVNDQKISGAVPLKNGDLVRLSGNIFRAEIDAPATAVLGPAIRSATLVEDAPGAPNIQQTMNIRQTFMNLRAVDADSGALRKANERFQTVLAVANAVQTKLNMEDLLADVLERLFQVFPLADRGLILLKGEDEKLVPHASRQRGTQPAGVIRTSRTVIRHAVEKRESILSADAMADDRFSASMTISGLQMRSMMCAPFIANEEVLGVVHLDTTRPGNRFSADDLELLTGVANQIALAIANAGMHRRLMVQERMARDLQLARQVQESFLPNTPPALKGLEFATSYKAALEIGGDFYDFIPLASGKLGIVLGDVAGKGIPAALLMARMVSDVRAFAAHEEDAAAVVGRLNDGLCARNANDSFVTLIYAILDPADRSLCIVNAAHPPVMVRKASGEVLPLESDANFPIGVMPDHQFAAQTTHLDAGDTLVIYSDGVSEAMNATKQMFGLDRLQAALAKPAASPHETLDTLLQDVHTHVAGAYQSDDLTVVCIRVL